MRKGGSHAGTVTVLPAPADAPTRRAGRVLVDMQLNKIRMVLLRNLLEDQAGSCTFEKANSASGLDGFATITAILFNCITIRSKISWQLEAICNASIFLPKCTAIFWLHFFKVFGIRVVTDPIFIPGTITTISHFCEPPKIKSSRPAEVGCGVLGSFLYFFQGTAGGVVHCFNKYAFQVV